MRKPLIAGNWKMHKTLAEARALVSGIRHGCENPPVCNVVDVLICPPFPLLFPMAKAIAGSGILLGAQNVHEKLQGAFTGEVSVAMLKDTGCSHVIIGHSERRHVLGEPPARLARKVSVALGGGLHVIYCVGETLGEREEGRTENVVTRQVEEVAVKGLAADRLVIAYEPVWAIGTGRTATPRQAQQVHELIRSQVGTYLGKEAASKLRILYGGSVKPENAGELLAEPDIDGALVGGACLVADDFVSIIRAAAKAKAA